MNPWKTPSLSIPTLTAEQQKVVDTVVQQRTEHFESVVAMLTEEVRSLKASVGQSKAQSKKKSQPAPQARKKQSSVQTQDKTPSAPASNFKGKANIDKQKEPAKKTSGRKSIPGPPPTALLSTPKRAIRATSAPPELGNTKPRKLVKALKKLEIVKAPSPRRHPQQMTTADVPREFNSTKASVPPAPELQYLQEFYQRFSTNNQVEHAAKTTSSPALISSNEIQLFKDATSGSVKYGQQVIHVGSNNVRYSQGLMGRLGLRVWCPNLEEDSASLYNAAHWIAAITTFQELVSSRAYDYMNVNPVLAMDSVLVIQAYNHYVHYVLLTKYKKEQKQEGKVAEEAENKKFSKGRERRYKYIIEPIGAHSDDELDPKRGFYKIKTLPYRSKNASKFFCALDIMMKKSAEQDASSNGKRQIRKLPKQPVLSSYTTAPTKLPIDFYDPKWYQNLTPAQQQTIPNIKVVAFLPDASESLKPKHLRHPDEKLTTSSFTRKYWDILVEPYGLLEAESSACDNESDNEAEDLSDRENSNSESKGHDLDATSPDVSEDEYHEEGDAGSLYDEDGFVTSDNNGNDNQDDDDQDNDEDGEDEDSGDEDWHEEGVNYEQDGDIAMKTNYGVSQAMLNIMEENEEGW
ncbi:hypothetical protein PCASD_04851 [Puccinia coronata f. sp. avenae]|uniref:Uncharacterized protein n=1 Tax=Puccinia coronata f. sp. avenae TaxID=200324 RepID=A0A2N5V259_9BASI|nr:hypothetical protein PCASD_04851 [Puccinia coronata f. sp. avenae]